MMKADFKTRKKPKKWHKPVLIHRRRIAQWVLCWHSGSTCCQEQQQPCLHLSLK